MQWTTLGEGHFLECVCLKGPEAMAVMHGMERWSLASADPSLVRSFIFQALAVAAPPYSLDFACILVR